MHSESAHRACSELKVQVLGADLSLTRAAHLARFSRPTKRCPVTGQQQRSQRELGVPNGMMRNSTRRSLQA